MAIKKERISKEEALSFLLTYIVVECGATIALDQLNLFNLSNLAFRAVDKINESDGIIPHEVIESLASEFMEESNLPDHRPKPAHLKHQPL